MRDLAPDITRQRLLIEGRYERELDAEAVARYLVDLDATDGATCAQDVVPFQHPSVPLGEALRLPVT